MVISWQISTMLSAISLGVLFLQKTCVKVKNKRRLCFYNVQNLFAKKNIS